MVKARICVCVMERQAMTALFGVTDSGCSIEVFHATEGLPLSFYAILLIANAKR